MCGLAGFNGAKADPLKIRVLGNMNESRGKHSCGIANMKEVHKGVGQNAEFSSFVKDKSLIFKQNTTVLVHTRHATVGKHSLENAHPFLIKANKKRSIMFAHNGTLICLNELEEEFNFKNVYGTDSEFLGNLICRFGPEKVLPKYKGAAALTWYYLNEPNVLYMWKGESKEFYHSEKTSVERPLHIVYTPEGMYYSSEKEPLDYICNNESTVYTIHSNVLYRFKDGKIDSKEALERNPKGHQKVNPYQQSSHFGLPSRNSMYSEHHAEKGLGVYDRENVEYLEEFTNLFKVTSPSEMYKLSNYIRKFYKHEVLNRAPNMQEQITQTKNLELNYYDLRLRKKHELFHGEYYLDYDKSEIYDKEEGKRLGLNPSYYINGYLLKGKKEYEYLLAKTGKTSSYYSVTLSNKQIKEALHPMSLFEEKSEFYLEDKLFTGVYYTPFVKLFYFFVLGKLQFVCKEELFYSCIINYIDGWYITIRNIDIENNNLFNLQEELFTLESLIIDCQNTITDILSSFEVIENTLEEDGGLYDLLDLENKTLLDFLIENKNKLVEGAIELFSTLDTNLIELPNE